MARKSVPQGHMLARSLSRRETMRILGAGALGVGLAGFSTTSSAYVMDSLATHAARAGILFGASVANEIESDAAYRRLYARETAILTTDWALKFDNLRPHPGVLETTDAERLLAFAKSIGVPLRGHALMWNENVPDWVKGLSLREIVRLFDEHIDTVGNRFSGRLHSWDVVNEPFWPGHGQPGGYRNGPWFEALGPSWIPRALRRLRNIDTRARLVINEARTEPDDELGRTIRENLLRMVKRLKDDDVPLDAVGLQGHLDPALPWDGPAFTDFLNRLAETGVDIYITELDVDDENLPGGIAERDRRVAQTCERFLRAALSVPAVRIVQTWQLSDRYSWYAGLARSGVLKTHRAPRPLPFDARLRRKPLWRAMARAFASRAA